MKNKENIIFSDFIDKFLNFIKSNKHHENFSLILSDEELNILEDIRVPFCHEVGKIIGDCKMEIVDHAYCNQTLKIRKDRK